MRLISKKMIYISRPFENQGASLYAGVGSAPGVDPGPESVKFREFRVIPPGLHLRGHTWSINNGVKKTSRVAHVLDPIHSIAIATPAAWLNRIVYLQVRTHWNDIENTSNPDPVRIDFTVGGAIDPKIHGVGSLVNIEKHDGGIYRIRVQYFPSTHGTQPTAILIRKSAGPGTLADVSATYFSDQRTYLLDTVPLTDAASYTFQAYAKNGAVELLLGSITFTADAAGPPAPTGLTLTAL